AFLMVNTSEIKSHENPVSLNIDALVGPVPIPEPGYVPSNSPKIGWGSAAGQVFRSQRSSLFTIGYVFNYQPDQEVGLVRDPAFAEMLNVCGITSSVRPARIDYEATTGISRLEFLGFRPSLKGSIYIDCPLTSEQLGNITSDPNLKTDPISALESALGNGTISILA
ncbi:hypothetical protein HK405_008744, partial [Cladochytrium tenue]